MRTITKLGLVIGGYLVACLCASGVVYVYQVLTDNAVTQASSGMYAFSDLLLLIGVFGILALLPTGLAFYFLIRSFKRS